VQLAREPAALDLLPAHDAAQSVACDATRKVDGDGGTLGEELDVAHRHHVAHAWGRGASLVPAPHRFPRGSRLRRRLERDERRGASSRDQRAPRRDPRAMRRPRRGAS